jgi:drug/metabolite transporter (DMT)-like permease
MDSFAFGALRYLITFFAFVPILLWREGVGAFSTGGHGKRIAVAGAIGLSGSTVLVFLGLTYTRAESAAIILALQPGMTALAHWAIHRRRPPNSTLICLAVALVGVTMVITRGGAVLVDQAAFRWSELGGNVLVLMGSMAWVTYVVTAAPLSHWSAARLSTLTTAWAAGVLCAVWLIAWLLGLSSVPVDLGAEDSMRMLYVSLLGAMLAILWWNEGVKRIGPLNAALFGYLMPVFAFALRALEGAVFSAAELSGAALVVVSLAANNLIERRRRA